MEVEEFPWLVYPPCVDLANSAYSTPAGRGDLLDSESSLAQWTATQRGRIPGVDGLHRRLEQVRRLRDVVRSVLYAAASGSSLPPDGVAELNAISASSPTYRILVEGRMVEATAQTEQAEPLAAFSAVVARSAIGLVGTAQAEHLKICEAPSCGMLFVGATARQVWCCHACGNRARVARHADRHARAARAGSSG